MDDRVYDARGNYIGPGREGHYSEQELAYMRHRSKVDNLMYFLEDRAHNGDLKPIAVFLVSSWREFLRARTEVILPDVYNIALYLHIKHRREKKEHELRSVR